MATETTAMIADLGLGGADVLIISESAKGVNATVKADYVCDEKTSNTKSSLSDVILTADSGYDIDMGEASGTFGFGINGGQAASTLKGSNRNDSITGNIGDDSLFGNKGKDTIEGGAGADLINTGRGNGYIKDAGIGADVITHDQGTSVVVQNTGTDSVTFTATRVNGYVVATAGERTVNAETSTFAITLNGSGAGENKVT